MRYQFTFFANKIFYSSNLGPLMTIQPLVEKYRPSTLDEVLGNELVISALKSLQEHDNLPHILLYGPPGTGKTTSIRAIAKFLYKHTIMCNVLELNASDDRGINVVREQIKSFAMCRSFQNKKKLVILDEADSMSRDAQNALRRVIEDYSGNVRFCLIANYAHKIIPAIQSRCSKFRFSPVSSGLIKERVKSIAEMENIPIDDKCIDMLVQESEGDMRTLINTLDGLSQFKGKITANMILPELDFEKVFELSRAKKYVEAKMMILEKLEELDFMTFFRRLTGYIRESKKFVNYDIYEELAQIEHRIAVGCSEKIQIACLVRVLGSY
ncbi:Replication factor C, subunit RFC5 [Trachipleistophora hominis]|uniref:Replication factor C, subunit RFC5 n=1 Tax=Trachipleistophora hominis TaxID=72359 RepID=L7JX32_TRAHO|nr:Replication factor C, subunit RFC5 [Trachipleistophora hominis]